MREREKRDRETERKRQADRHPHAHTLYHNVHLAHTCACSKKKDSKSLQKRDQKKQTKHINVKKPMDLKGQHRNRLQLVA